MLSAYCLDAMRSGAPLGCSARAETEPGTLVPMIDIVMALALGVAPIPDPIVNVDDPSPGPYTYLETPCTQLAAGYPGLVNAFCIDEAEVVVGGLGAQVEFGQFRARLTEGYFRENAYITRQSWQFLEPVGQDPEWRTARGAYALVCVNQNNGLIERNGPLVWVVTPAEQRQGASTISLSTSGQCRIGWEREVLSMWAFSDSALPWLDPSDFDRTRNGWEGGVRSFTYAGVTFTGTVPQVPEWREDGGFMYGEISMDAATRARIAEVADNAIACNALMRQLFPDDGNMNFYGLQSGGFPNTYGRNGSTVVFNYSWWCNPDRPGIITAGLTDSTQANWNWIEDRYDGYALTFAIEDNVIRFKAPGTPDRFEADNSIWLAASLTKNQGVADINWVPEEIPRVIGDVEGLCLDGWTECFSRCFDVDWSWNIGDSIGELLGIVQCAWTPDTDLPEMFTALRVDMENSLMGQSLILMTQQLEDLVSAPAFYSRWCAQIYGSDMGDVGMGSADFSLNTCDIEPEVRDTIFTASTIVLAAGIIFKLFDYAFWIFGQRNILVAAAKADDEAEAAGK